MPLELLFVSQYKANVYIMPAGEAQKFVDNNAFDYYPAFSIDPGKFGYKPMELGIGSYALGIENTSATSNSMRVELQNQATVPGFRYSGTRFNAVAENVNAGGRFTQQVTVGSTYRTVIDGANSGGTVYLIPLSEQSKFLAGQQFSYYTDQPCSSGTAAPGFCEIKYAPGVYVIAYHNDTTEPHSLIIYGFDYVPD